MMKHTSGTWKVATYSNKNAKGTHKGIYSQDGIICDLWTRPDCDANAALIAAAPELLTALKILLDALSRGADTVATAQAVKQARAAIETATK